MDGGESGLLVVTMVMGLVLVERVWVCREWGGGEYDNDI